MRKYIDINLGKRSVTNRELHGREIAECGRYLIAKMLLEQNIACVKPLAPENPLIFSVGPFAGTNFSNAINDAFDAGVTPDFIRNIGLETLRLEAAFNDAAGFDEEDDELPSFFLDEPLPPTDKIARFRSGEVNAAMRNLLDAHCS